MLEETIKNTSTIFRCADLVEPEGVFNLRFSFGIAAPYVRWITLYFLPHSQFSPRKLGTYHFNRINEEKNDLEYNIVLSIEPPGVLRALVYYEGFGIREYSREITITEENTL